MKLLITGANGFVGRQVVASALAHGHGVRAMVRISTDISQIPWRDSQDLEIVRADLRSPTGLNEAVRGVDGVLHLAATMSGDLYAQMAGTVVATENLLSALEAEGVHRMVLVSSFSVYDYRSPWTFSSLDETSPTEAHPQRRDGYCLTKLMQENLARRAAEAWGLKLTVLRPGVIYGPGHEWTARLGVQLSPRRWLRIGSFAPLPLTYVENCAEAIVMCGDHDAAIGQTFNVVDDETPTQHAYSRLLQQRLEPRPRIVPVPRWAFRGLAGMAWLVDRIVFRGNARVPQILRSASLDARCKPLRYQSRRLRKAIGWSPRYSLREGLDRCFGETA